MSRAGNAKGLSHTAAVCAVARNLAKVYWSLVAHETEYDPARVWQAPAAPAKNPDARTSRRSTRNFPLTADRRNYAHFIAISAVLDKKRVPSIAVHFARVNRSHCVTRSERRQDH